MKVEILGRYLFISLLVLALATPVHAQRMVADTLSTKKEKIHSPHKATIYSMVLPGLGQAYNKKYWKIPLIYIGFATIGYYINWNNSYYQQYSKGYRDLTDNIDETKSYEQIKAIEYLIPRLDDSNTRTQVKDYLQRNSDNLRRNRDLLFISVFGFYALNIIDASVDAHFFNFDVSDDLTFQWQPSMYRFDDQNVFCVNCTINF